MSIRRIVALLLAIIMMAALAGCAKEPVAESTATAAPPTVIATPTPEPKVGIEAVFDKKKITVAVISNGDQDSSTMFFEGVQKEGQSLGVIITTQAAKNNFNDAVSDAVQNGADAIIACLIESQTDYSALNAAVVLGIPVSVYEMQEGKAPEGMSYLYYQPDGELDMSFEAALVYPPHDAPVRLILMLESVESDGYMAYQALYEQGMIFPKETYIAADSELEAGEWLTEKLDSYVEGMLDAVYAENLEMAISAYDVLAALGRTDMEVFCPGVTQAVIQRMQSNPEVFAQAVGQNDALAGVLSLRLSLQMLKGAEIQTLSFEPALINAVDFRDDAAAAMAAMDVEKSELFESDWMDMLREYYSSSDVSEEN